MVVYGCVRARSGVHWDCLNLIVHGIHRHAPVKWSTFDEPACCRIFNLKQEEYLMRFIFAIIVLTVFMAAPSWLRT